MSAVKIEGLRARVRLQERTIEAQKWKLERQNKLIRKLREFCANEAPTPYEAEAIMALRRMGLDDV